MTDDDPTLPVAIDLRAILDLSRDLPRQAAHQANSRLMPGGLALVAIGPIASPEAAGYIVDTAETRRPEWLDEIPDNDDTWEPPYQTLRYWSEAWRVQHDRETDRPTLATEAAFLARVLRWAYDHEPHWGDFAKDVRQARVRLEDLLHDGERSQHTAVKCRDCGEPLVRRADEAKPCTCQPPGPHGPLYVHQRGVCCLACRRETVHSGHNQGGLPDEWHCTGCRRTYGLDEYRTLLARDALDNATALTADKLAERFDVTIGQVRVWANRGHIRKHGRDELGRMLYDVADVQARLADTTATG